MAMYQSGKISSRVAERYKGIEIFLVNDVVYAVRFGLTEIFWRNTIHESRLVIDYYWQLRMN